MTSRRGFTLIEILVAAMLAGLLSGLALAPVVVTVRRVVDTQRDYSDISALSRTMNFIARDLSSVMRMSPTALVIKEHEALGGKAEDILIFPSMMPAMQGMSGGTVVYAVTEGGILHGNVIPGLYRWIFPGINPADVNTETLNPQDAQLVLPGADEFCAEVPKNSRDDERSKEYTGQLPPGIFLRISRHEGGTVESVISLP